jgi:hypothetical protein
MRKESIAWLRDHGRPGARAHAAGRAGVRGARAPRDPAA